MRTMILKNFIFLQETQVPAYLAANHWHTLWSTEHNGHDNEDATKNNYGEGARAGEDFSECNAKFCARWG